MALIFKIEISQEAVGAEHYLNMDRDMGRKGASNGCNIASRGSRGTNKIQK